MREPRAVGVRADGDLDDLARGVLEEAVDVRGRPHVAAAHGEQILAGADVDARLGERRAQLRDSS